MPPMPYPLDGVIFMSPSTAGSDVIYFTGNSLGLQPKAAEAALRTELNDWAEHGVEGHFQGPTSLGQLP